MSDIKFELSHEQSYNDLVGGGKKRKVVTKKSKPKSKPKKTSELSKIEKTAINAIRTFTTPDYKKAKKLMGKTLKDEGKIKAVKVVESLANKIVKAVKGVTDKAVKKVKKVVKK